MAAAPKGAAAFFCQEKDRAGLYKKRGAAASPLRRRLLCQKCKKTIQISNFVAERGGKGV